MIAARPKRARRRVTQGAGLVVAATVCAVGIASAPAGAVVGQLATASDSTSDAPVAAAPHAFIGPRIGANPQVAGPEVAAAGVVAATSAAAVANAPVRAVSFTSALPDQRAAIAIRTALAQVGLPYVWGGNGPTNGDAGFDCSGLTTFAYAAAGIALPRTAHTQYYAGPHVPAGAPLQPGDLVFYGTPAFVHHVGLYLGDGKMVNAPTFGKLVQVAYYRYAGDDYIGATRPASTGALSTGELPLAPTPEAVHPAAPETFPAPVAPAPTEVPDPLTPQPGESQSAQQALEDQTTTDGAATSATTATTPSTSAPVYGPTVAAPEGTTTAATPPASTAPSSVAPASTPAAPEPTTPSATAAPVTSTTGASPTATTTHTTTPQPATPQPATPKAAPPKPATAEPATSKPAATTTTAPPTVGAAEAAAVPSTASLTTGSTTVTLRSVKADSAGIPVSVGIHGHTVRVGSTGGLRTGSTLVLTAADGTIASYSVTAVTTMSAGEAAAAITATRFVVLAPAADGSWTVVLAG